MSLNDWFGDREILITGVTSRLGRTLLEKLLRSFPGVKVHLLLRPNGNLSPADRVKKIFDSPGYDRVQLERPKAMSSVIIHDGNLVETNIGLKNQDIVAMSNVSVVFHMAGPSKMLLDYCRKLTRLKAVVLTNSLFSCKEDIVPESLMDEKLPTGLPLAMVRIPALGPANSEPMPGFTDILNGPSALMVGAGFVVGQKKIPVEIIPVDIAINTMIVTAWDIGQRNSPVKEPIFYNASTIGGTWGELLRKGNRADRKFPHPKFRVRGMTSSIILHWVIVSLFEWLPSALCDIFLSVTGQKARFIAEHVQTRQILDNIEVICNRRLSVQREKIQKIDKRLNSKDRELFPICGNVDIEAYILCSAAAIRKYCANEKNLKIISIFRSTLMILVGSILSYYYVYYC